MYYSLVLVMVCVFFLFLVFFFKQKTAYEMRISDWSSDVCSSDLPFGLHQGLVLLRQRIARFGEDAQEIVRLQRIEFDTNRQAALQFRHQIRRLGKVKRTGRDEQQDRKSTRLNSSH